jgi:hypothetical protein
MACPVCGGEETSWEYVTLSDGSLMPLGDYKKVASQGQALAIYGLLVCKEHGHARKSKLFASAGLNMVPTPADTQ